MIPLIITRRSLLKAWVGLAIYLATDRREGIIATPEAASIKARLQDRSDSTIPDDAASDADGYGMDLDHQTCDQCTGTGYLDEPWYLLNHTGVPHPCQPCRGSGYLTTDGGGFPWGPGGTGWT